MCGPEDEDIVVDGEVIVDNTTNDNRSDYADEDPDPNEN